MRQFLFSLCVVLCIGFLNSCNSDESTVLEKEAQQGNVKIINNPYVVDKNAAIEEGAKFLDDLQDANWRARTVNPF